MQIGAATVGNRNFPPVNKKMHRAINMYLIAVIVESSVCYNNVLLLSTAGLSSLRTTLSTADMLLKNHREGKSPSTEGRVDF